MDQIAHLDAVGVSLGGQRVLRDVDLTLAPGSSLGIVGPNGSGKTTLVRAIATLTAIDTGALALFGQEVTPERLNEVRRSVGLIGHTPALIPELSLIENLSHIARIARIPSERVTRAIEVVGLDQAAHRRSSASSYGMRRRIEIAHLLLTKPRLLLLDEAVSGLDESARELIAALVESVKGRQGAVVVVSHDRAQLDHLCDTVSNLDGGRLVGAV